MSGHDPYDLSCECWKYYSCINSTKKFEDKNLFVPR